ncbi:hypothetical protein ACFX1Q_003893 [Malus domestica]
MDFATIQAQLAKLTSQLSQMPKGPQCKVSQHMVCPMGKDIQLINVLNSLRMKMFGVNKAIANHGTTCFPTLTIRIGEIFQITCGENLNNSNKMSIGSKKRSFIQDLCSHHNNLPNSIQVCLWIMICLISYSPL